MTLRRAWLLFASVLFVSPILAHATPLLPTTPAVYTFTVIGSGTFDGVAFTDKVVTFKTTTTLGAVSTVSSGKTDHVTHTPTTVSVAGLGSDTLTDSISFSVNRNGSAGVADSTEGLSVLALLDDAFKSISMFDNSGPISASALGVSSFTDSTPTSNGGLGGILYLSSESTGTYSAQIGAPVPEPSSLLLLATGIAGAAGAIRKRLV